MKIVEHGASYFYCMLQYLFEDVYIFGTYGPKLNTDHR